jgi:hypothetical protein
MAEAKQQLGAAAFDKEWKTGEALPLEQALEDADAGIRGF